MAAVPPMDPNLERRLRDEVLYLHSLWHQGPSRLPPPATYAAANPAVRNPLLGPSQTTQFKQKPSSTTTAASVAAAVEAAAAEASTPPGTEWPGWSPKPNRKPQPISPEEQSKLLSKNAHKNALKVVGEFLRSNDGDSEDSDAIANDGDEEENGESEEVEVEAEYDCPGYYAFFLKVFNEDAGLREYYTKTFANGVFSCLVCGGLGGRKTWKKFRGCLALVQHSITISKTKNRRAHRALGQAVCKILGWDIDQLPTVASLLSEKSADAEGNGGADKDGVDIVGSLEGENVENGGAGIVHNGNEGNVNPSICPDAAGNDSDGLSMVALEGLTSVTPVEIPGVGRECKNW